MVELINGKHFLPLCVDRGISPKEEVILYEQIRSHGYCETS